MFTLERNPDPPNDPPSQPTTFDDFAIQFPDEACRFILDAIEGDETSLYRLLPSDVREKVDEAIADFHQKQDAGNVAAGVVEAFVGGLR
jgi:hypothetical protein